jgi:hypothetical protein
MKPFIILTTPRTGSTVATNLVYNLTKSSVGYKGNLWEFFSVDQLTHNTYEIINGTVVRTSHSKPNAIWWTESVDSIRLKRLEMLKYNHRYMIKLFPGHCHTEIIDFIKPRFNVIFLERKNKIHQILSILSLMQTNKPHYLTDDVDKINSIMFDKTIVDSVIGKLTQYYQIKSTLTGKTVFYEDFVKYGFSEETLKKQLNLSITDYVPMNIPTKATPYSDKNPENLIINKDLWLEHRQDIVNQLQELDV